MRRLIPSAVVLVVLAVAPTAQAVPKAWNGSVNIQWNNAANWTPAGIPTAADDVTIPIAGTVRVANVGAITADAVANTVTITAAGAVTVDRRNLRLLTVTNGITVNSSAAVAISVPFTAASLTQSGSGTTTLNGTALGGTVPQVATVSVTAGNLTLNGGSPLSTSGLVTVGAGATLTRNNAGTLDAGGGVSVSGGTMTFGAGGGLNSGSTVSVSSGSISFAGAGGLAATDVTLGGGSISFAGSGDLTATGTLSVGAGATVSTSAGANISAGTVGINGGTIAFGGNGSLTAGGAVSLTGGGSLSFAGSGDVAAQSFSLASGSTYTINFATGANPTTINLTGGSGALNGTVNITGTPNPNTSFNIVTGAGSVDITGVTLGTVPAGEAFGFHLAGTTTIVLDTTVNPIAPDATGSATGSCGSPLTWQHTIGATANDRYLLVGVSTGASAVTPTSVSFGAQPMALLTSQVTGTSGAFLYGLVAPTRGTATITVTLPAGPCSAVGGSLSYTGVDQATSTGTAATAGGTGTTASVSPSTVQGDKVISVLSSNGATSATPQAGAIVRWSASSGAVLGAGDTASRTGGGTFNVTMSWTLAPSSPFALVAIPIHAVAPTRAADLAVWVRDSARGPVVSLRSGPVSDLVGFRVWRETSGRRELLTPGLIAGPVLTTKAVLAGNDVGWEDRHAPAGASYLVESLHLDGRTRWTRATAASGPASPVAANLVADSPTPVNRLSSIRGSAAVVPAARVSALNQSKQWELAAGDAVKLVVSRPGVVRVPAESLFAAGMSPGAPTASLQLFRNGRAVPRTVVAADGATLRSGDWVEFYGYGMDTRYSGSSVYWLTSSGGVGLDLRNLSASAQPAGPATYLASVEVRERLTWFGAARNGDAEKFFGPAVLGQGHQRTLSLDGLDVSASGARLEVALQGVLDTPHSVTVRVNGLGVGSLSFSGNSPSTASIALPPGVLVPGDNVVGLSSSSDQDLSLEQYVRVVYPRFTTRSAGALDFTLEAATSARLQGFDPARTRILDVTDPDSPVQLAVQDAGGTAAVLATGTGTRHLFAYLPEDAAAPDAITRNGPSRWWASEGADLIVLGPSTLFDAVQPLVERRRSEGLTVALVDIEDVQDEFASGEKSIDAVRAFLAQALTGWSRPPRYLLILGSASYDPRNYLGSGGDLVPTSAVQLSAPDAVEAASDSWFLSIPAARSLSVGRFPVRTPEETQALVTKILARREATVRSPWLLISDWAAKSDFPEMTADLKGLLPDAPATVLLREHDVANQEQLDAQLRQKVLDAAKSGPLVVNYIGHASAMFWGQDDGFFTSEDVAALAGTETALWIHMTCFTGFFEDPKHRSLAVEALLASSGGAWGAWASSGMTYPGDHSAVDRALVRALLIQGKTLGEATRDALAFATDPEVQSTFVLLGDPSARAVATQALETAPKPAASGCSTTQSGSASLLLLGILAVWGATLRRRPVAPRD